MAKQKIEIISGSELISFLPKSDVLANRTTFFHSPSWIGLWDAQPDFAAFSVVLLDGNDLLGYLPFCTRGRYGIRECYSMPIGTYGGTVGFDDVFETTRSITAFFVEWCRKKRYARTNVIEFDSRCEPLYHDFVTRKVTTHIIRLDVDSESFQDGISEGHRRNIRKCDNSELESRVVATQDDVAAYYSLITESARRHDSKAAFSLEFYKSLLKHVSEDCILWNLAIVSGEPCAGHIYFKWGGNVVYWDGASNQTGLDQRANYYLFWKNIRQFMEEGYQSLNLGASPPCANELVRFKKGWGAVEACYYEYDKSGAIYRGLKHIKDWLR